MIITVVLEALTGTFNTDIDRSAKQAERALKRMEAESRKSLAQFGKIIAGAATAAAAGFAVMVKSAINNADELGKLSQKVGVTVEDLSKLAYAAQLSDVELGGLQQGLIKLGDAAVQTQTGTGDAAKAFEALGISVRDAEGNLKSNYELLLEVSDAFAGYADGAAKSAVAIDIFGRSGANLIPLLNGGSVAIRQAGDELERFGGVVSQDVANAADEFNDNLDRIAKAGTSLAAQVASELLPDLKRLSEQFLDLVGDGEGVSEIASQIADSFRVLSRVVIVVSNVFQNAGNSLGAFYAILATAISGDFAGAVQIFKESKADFVANNRDIQRALEDTGKAAKETGGLIGSILGQGLGQRTLNYDPEAARKAVDTAKKAAQEARRAQEAFAQADAEIFQALQDRERAALEASLDLRLISHRQYLAEKLRLTEAEIDQEIQASQSLLQNAEASEAVLLQARIESLEIQRQIAREEHAAEEAKHVLELADAYKEAARAAKSYVDEISREGQRTLEAFDQSPAQRRFSAGQFQIEDQFRSEREQLEQEFDSGNLEQAEYDKRLSLLQGYHEKALAEHARYFDLIEQKRNDFNTSFNNSIQEYVESTSNIGETLGETFVSAIDEAIASTSRLAAEFILFGEGGKDAIYQIARQLSTTLLSALIQVGLQLLINKALLSGFSSGGSGATPFGFSDGSFASGGYTGDDPRNKVAGVVHGQEFVVNPDATRKNRGLLEAINSGETFDSAANVPSSSSQGLKPTTNVRIINVPDKAYIKDYLMGDEGDEVFTNWVGRNGVRLKNAVANA